jgi:hypothetical protein
MRHLGRDEHEIDDHGDNRSSTALRLKRAVNCPADALATD